MNKYPYIGEYMGNVTLFTGKDSGVSIVNSGCEQGYYSEDWGEIGFTNITREYLANTYGEVLSPEHAEFIIELCRVNGVKCIHKNESKQCNSFTVSNGELSIYLAGVVQLYTGGLKQITIPLPPKADKSTNISYTITKGIKRIDDCEDFELCGTDSSGCAANVSVSFNDNNEILKVKAINPPKADTKKWAPDFYELGEPPKHVDCVCNKCGGKCCTGLCDKQEPREWPQIGDEVCWSNGCYKGVVKARYWNDLWVMESDGEFSTLYIDDVSKPKTPEEKFLDDLKFDIGFLNSTYEKPSIITEKLLEKYDIKKKPQ